MNQLLPYEKVIAKKMKQLPAPDMADAIWGNIQAQLNVGLEDMQGNVKDVVQKVTGKSATIIWWIAGCIIVIIICVLLFRQKRHLSPSPKKNIPEKTEQGLPINKSKNEPETSQVSNHDIKKVYPANGIIMDSIKIIPKTEPSLQTGTDSIGISKTFPLKVDSLLNIPVIMPGKKSIGVKGISDSSYRILGKRDSMK